MSPLLRATLLAAVLAVASACADLNDGAPIATASFSASAPAPGTLQTGHQAMVIAANPLAAQAGLHVLQSGGSAADAAVAVQAVLGLVEPQSSGLGGGAFITYYDAHSHKVIAYNGRETAPAAATNRLFLDANGRPLSYPTAVLSGRSTGVPGAIAALHRLQHEHGKLRWRQLFGEAEWLAQNGFQVSPRLARMIGSRAPQTSAPDVLHYFTKADGSRYAQGDLLRNPAYAASLERIAAHGIDGLLRGPIARDIVERVHQGDLPGELSLQDLARYQPLETAALCRPWRQFRVCTPPPPSGGSALLQAMLLVAQTDIATRNAQDPQAWVEIGEAQRLMYADRSYVADPAFVAVPTEGLLDPGYIHGRAALIGAHIAAQAPTAGHPPGSSPSGPDHTIEPGGTTNVVIADAAGDVLCMTTTVESIFGDGRMVDGFFLNNQLTDFSFTPTDPDGQPAANAVAAGKRPRSAMTPTIVLDADGRVVAAVGSAGGPAIIAYVLKTLIANLDWHLPIHEAVSLPNLVARGNGFGGEADRFAPDMLQKLHAVGIDLRPGQFEESGLTALSIDADGTLHGSADPRREGVVLAY